VNPRPVVGTIPVWGDQVLLCRRAIEPRYGKWTLPAGFMEIGETTAEGAIRETAEEAGARIQLGPLFSMLDVPHVEQVHLFFCARLLDLDFAPGQESLEVRLFVESEIPWEELAFRTVSTTLRWYFEDRARGAFATHADAIRPPARAPA
jgi:ADP-ribose pyrophosphatase YjhB (NUDIX family)